MGHPCGDREQVGRRTSQEREGQRGWRQSFRGKGNGSGGGEAHGTCTEAASPTKPLSLPTSSNPPDPQTCGGP